jgi:hypothetical protein
MIMAGDNLLSDMLQRVYPGGIFGFPNDEAVESTDVVVLG